MRNMPRRHETFMAGVLAHRADPNSILHSDISNLEGLKESRNRSSIAGLDGQTRRRILLGGEEGNALCSLVDNGVAAFLSLCGCRSFGPRYGNAVVRVADAVGEICSHGDECSDRVVMLNDPSATSSWELGTGFYIQVHDGSMTL